MSLLSRLKARMYALYGASRGTARALATTKSSAIFGRPSGVDAVEMVVSIIQPSLDLKSGLALRDERKWQDKATTMKTTWRAMRPPTMSCTLDGSFSRFPGSKWSVCDEESISLPGGSCGLGARKEDGSKISNKL